VEVLVGDEADVHFTVDDGRSSGKEGQEREQSVETDFLAGNGSDDASDGQEGEEAEDESESEDGGKGLRVPVGLQIFGEAWYLRLALVLRAQGVQGDEDEWRQGHEEQGSEPGETEA